MKLAVQVKLLPTPEQASALESTLRACNSAANEVSNTARALGSYRNYDLRKLAYCSVKAEYGLGAQAAQHVIKKVSDAYASGKRRQRAEADPIRFRPMAAQPYDARMLSWQHSQRTVSIWTTHGRLRQVAFTGSPDQLRQVATLPVGESDLVHRDGKWFLYVTCDVPEAPLAEPASFLGVDLGIVNIAYDSDGCRYVGARLNGYRRRQRQLRARLQAKNTKSARRLLARRRKKETRHAAHINHTITKSIVTEAARTGRGIAVEDLTGIRDRVRLRKPQRVTLSSWSFHQLAAFLAYKARRTGVALVEVDPRYTSQTCYSCGHRDKRNRTDQETFHCRSCGVVAHADHNAARNIASRGAAGWGAVNRPHAA